MSRQLAGRYGGLKSWANTPDRSARTAPARSASPSDVTYWLARLDPDIFADATDEQRLAAAESALRAHFAGMALKSAQARARAKGAAAAAALAAQAVTQGHPERVADPGVLADVAAAIGGRASAADWSTVDGFGLDLDAIEAALDGLSA